MGQATGAASQGVAAEGGLAGVEPGRSRLRLRDGTPHAGKDRPYLQTRLGRRRLRPRGHLRYGLRWASAVGGVGVPGQGCDEETPLFIYEGTAVAVTADGRVDERQAGDRTRGTTARDVDVERPCGDRGGPRTVPDETQTAGRPASPRSEPALHHRQA